MKIVLDTELMKKEDIGIEGCLYLLSMYFKAPITSKTFDVINDKGFTYIKSFFNTEPIDISITPNGIDFTEKLIVDSSVIEVNNGEDRYKVLAEKLRELFPKGKKQGTNLQWRDSLAIITTRLKTLVKKYDAHFTDEQAIQAAKNYIASFNGDYRYMHVLKYFIFKNINNGDGVEQNSQLLAFIENIESDNIGNNDWLNTLK